MAAFDPQKQTFYVANVDLLMAYIATICYDSVRVSLFHLESYYQIPLLVPKLNMCHALEEGLGRDRAEEKKKKDHSITSE